MKEFLNIGDVLKSEGKYVGPTTGGSMLPMLKTGRDSVVIRAKTARLKRLDVALYKRGNDYVLHRVVGVRDDGYVIRGDNCYEDEYVPEGNVLGVLTEFFRGEKFISCTDRKYLDYAERRLRTYSRRRFFVRIKRRLKGFVKKILRWDERRAKRKK